VLRDEHGPHCCFTEVGGKQQFRRWVEVQIEAADGAPAAHVTVLGGLAEFERQPIRGRASALWRTV
jgi:hypothetical protein